MFKKIKLYIVTYRNPTALNNNLESLFKSDINDYPHEVNIINNHSTFELKSEFNDRVNVFHNDLRPDFSTGHLARNWNEAIINGFKDLSNPDCEYLVHVQDDTLFLPNWVKTLIRYHQQYSFIQNGWGDTFCSYTVDAVRKIGLWDERYCNIGYQEADYFLRALIYNKEHSSINDFVKGHNRVLNPLPEPIIDRPLRDEQPDYHKVSTIYHSISAGIFKAKYCNMKYASQWTEQLIANPPKKCKIFNYVYYPYFEKNIDNLQEKKYLLPHNSIIIEALRKVKHGLEKILGHKIVLSK